MIASPLLSLPTALLNHLAQPANWARQRLQPFAGKRAMFVMPGFGYTFEVTHEGLFQPTPRGSPADVTIFLPPDLPHRLPHYLLQGIEGLLREVRVEGNAEFATELSFVLKHLDWDLEAALAPIVGDIAAHRMVGLLAPLNHWRKSAVSNVKANAIEYLVYEQKVVVSREEWQRHVLAIASFDQRLDAAERRLKRDRRQGH